jgi:hypothetical protein
VCELGLFYYSNFEYADLDNWVEHVYWEIVLIYILLNVIYF